MASKKFNITSKLNSQGWTNGKIGKYEFSAKVYDEGSYYGINGGRVSKLMIWDEAAQKPGNHTIANYDRRWDIEPGTTEEKRIFMALMEYLEALPIEG